MKMMKHLGIIAGFLLLCGVSEAQYYYRPAYVPEWQGPKRAWIGGGMVQRIGVPSFSSWGSDGSIHPDAFSSPMNMGFSIGIDLESGEEGFSTGPYFHFDYSKDGWTADFSSERPSNFSNPANANFIFRYDMTCMHIGGAFGWGFYYHIGDMLEVGLGGGLYLMGTTGTKYSSTIIRKADNAVMPQTDDVNWVGESTNSNPMNIGVEGKFEALFFFAEDMFVGLQARYDAYPFYCSLDDTPNYVGDVLVCSDNNRPRIVGLLTLGARW